MDLRGDLMRARHRVGKLLLRHDVRFEGHHWTRAHRDWLAGELLATSVEIGPTVTLADADRSESVTVEGDELTLAVRRA